MDQKEKTDIRSLNLKELTVFMEQLGEKRSVQSRFTSGFMGSRQRLLRR